MGIIGCHLSAKEGFLGMALQTTALHGNTFQCFMRNPQGYQARPWDPSRVKNYIEYADTHGIGPIVGYAPYTENAASDDASTAEFARMVIMEDLERMEQVPGQIYLMHAGSATHEDPHEGVGHVIDIINSVVASEQTTKICFSNSPGAGHELASSFEEMAEIRAGVQLDGHVGTCLDVSAAWGAGYDMKDKLDEVIDEFDRIVGLEHLDVVHLSDPKYDLGTHHAQHERIGEGQLGLEGLKAIFTHPKLDRRVFILETPHAELDVYELAMKYLLGA